MIAMGLVILRALPLEGSEEKMGTFREASCSSAAIQSRHLLHRLSLVERRGHRHLEPNGRSRIRSQSLSPVCELAGDSNRQNSLMCLIRHSKRHFTLMKFYFNEISLMAYLMPPSLLHQNQQGSTLP